MMGKMVGAVVHGKGSAAPPVVMLVVAALCPELVQVQVQVLVCEDNKHEEASDVSMMAPEVPLYSIYMLHLTDNFCTLFLRHL